MDEWKPIETAPAESSDSDRDPPLILLWVADANGKKGAVSFGYVHLRKSGQRKAIASGYGGNHEWKITHWMPIPKGPE